MRIGFCNGCFDLFHEGHKYFLRQAHEQCDWLIVAVNDDQSIKQLKGVDRPKDNLAKRLDRLSGCPHVDTVLPFDGDPLPLLQAIRPSILFRGSDQSFSEIEREYIGQLLTITRILGYSTSAKIATLRP